MPVEARNPTTGVRSCFRAHVGFTYPLDFVHVSHMISYNLIRRLASDWFHFKCKVELRCVFLILSLSPELNSNRCGSCKPDDKSPLNPLWNEPMSSLEVRAQFLFAWGWGCWVPVLTDVLNCGRIPTPKHFPQNGPRKWLPISPHTHSALVCLFVYVCLANVGSEASRDHLQEIVTKPNSLPTIQPFYRYSYLEASC